MANTSDDSLKKPNIKDNYSKKQLDELTRCYIDPIYFAENFIKIQHTTKGAIPFKPFAYQKHMITAFKDHKYVVALTSRQNGKTTCAAAYLLWRAMFSPDSTILIVANLFAQAMEIVERIKYAYEYLPDFIRAGVKEYSKSKITFDNNSRIIARATTANAGRGLSVSYLYCDEFSFVPPNIQKDFWAAIQPVLATGGRCIITSTPKSDEDQFAEIWRGANDTTDDFGNELNSNGAGRNGFFPVKSYWYDHPERDEEWARPFKESLGKKFFQEFECVSANTKINLKSHEKFTLSMGDLYTKLAAQ